MSIVDNKLSVKEAFADAVWEAKREFTADALKAIKPNIEDLVDSVLHEVSDLDDEEETQIKDELVEEFTELLRRGMGRAFKRIKKEYGE